MTAKARAKKPAATPDEAPTPALARPFAAVERDYEVAHEVIRTRCGRVVERTAVVIDMVVRGNRFKGDPDKRIKSIAHDNTYRLWEPKIEGARYGVTRTNDKGVVWGLAHTRQPSQPLPVTEWEMSQWSRAVAVIVATCVELGGEGVSDGILTCCGTVRLLGSPKITAERVTKQRREVPAS